MNDMAKQHARPLRAVHPLVEVWSLAWPTVLTMTSYTIMQFIDRLMVGQVGPLELAAQGNAQIWSFAPIAFSFGVLTVVNTFVSQNFGAGRPEEGPKYAWAAVWLSIALWLGALIPWAFLLPFIYRTMQHSDALYAMEVGYAQIMLGGAIVLLIGRGLHHYFFGLHRPKVVTISAIIGNISNVILNYILIFGENGLPAIGLPGIQGVPAMGVYGAAIATVFGSFVEMAIPACVFLGTRMNKEFQSRSAWRPQWQPIKDLIKVGWPASIQFGSELTCWAIFSTVLVGQFGEEHLTAGWIAFGYMHLSFMPTVGISVATTSLVGKYIGAGKPDIAAARARLSLGLAMVYMTICAVAFYILRYPLVDLFIASDVPESEAQQVLEIGAKLMVCAAFFQTVDAFGIIYTGALRGAGDTIWPGVVTILYSWLFLVGAGYAISRYWPSIESVGPWLGATVYIVMYGLTMWRRFANGRWRSIKLLHDMSEDAAEVAPIGPGVPTDPAAAVRDLAESYVESID